MSPALGLTLTVIFLAVNAYFVAAEFAVTSSRRSQLEPLAAEGVRGARSRAADLMSLTAGGTATPL